LHALEKGQFEMFGILTAIALLNGCPGPHFLCHSLASFILDNQVEVVLDDVPAESEFKTKLIQIIISCPIWFFLFGFFIFHAYYIMPNLVFEEITRVKQRYANLWI
jgi:hypothetical protein